MNEPIFNLNQPYTIDIRQQWLPPGAANCMVFNFKGHQGRLVKSIVPIPTFQLTPQEGSTNLILVLMMVVTSPQVNQYLYMLK